MPMLAGGVEAPAADLERCDERFRDALGDHHRFGAVVQAVEQHRELVAAEAGEHVVAAHDRLHPVRDLDEEGVAGAVAEGVVDELEVVEVEVQHADHRAVATRRRHRSLELIAERGPIRQAGQLVAQRLLAEAGIGLAQARVGFVVPFPQLQLAHDDTVHLVVQRGHHDEVDRYGESEQPGDAVARKHERREDQDEHRDLRRVVVEPSRAGADDVGRRSAAARTAGTPPAGRRGARWGGR